jgi:hypothetical protein
VSVGGWLVFAVKLIVATFAGSSAEVRRAWMRERGKNAARCGADDAILGHDIDEDCAIQRSRIHEALLNPSPDGARGITRSAWCAAIPFAHNRTIPQSIEPHWLSGITVHRLSDLGTRAAKQFHASSCNGVRMPWRVEGRLHPGLSVSSCPHG